MMSSLGKVPIFKFVQRVPGGLMVVPLVLGTLTNTFIPEAINIGSFTTFLFRQGAMPLIAVMLFCSGAQITFRTAGVALWKGVVLNTSKVLLGMSLGLIIGMIFGQHGTWLGLTPLALVSAMSNSNGGMYAALASKYGDESDVGALAIISTNDGPFFEMAFMAGAGLANIPLMTLVAVVVPILIGMILGNLDDELRQFLKPGIMIAIPFFAFPLGAGLSLRQLIAAGPPGILLGLFTMTITGIGSYFVFKLLVPKKFRKNAAVGAAVGTSAGNSVATPAAFAAADPSFAPYAPVAAAQVSASIVITAIFTPFLVDFLSKLEEKKGGTSKGVGIENVGSKL